MKITMWIKRSLSQKMIQRVDDYTKEAGIVI